MSHVDFATDEHFDVWRDACRTVVEAIRRAGLPMVVLAPAWAGVAEDLSIPVRYRGISAATWNEKYARYVDHLEAMGVKVIRIAADEVKSSTAHQWGLEPFHYEDNVYERMQVEIKHHLAHGSSRPRPMARILAWWRERARTWKQLRSGR